MTVPPNNSFKPSPLRGLGHTGPQRAGRLNSGVRLAMRFSRAMLREIALVLAALVACVIAVVIYHRNTSDRLIEWVQRDIQDQGALAHALVQYGTENPDVRIDKFELCKTCHVSVVGNDNDWSTTWQFTMLVESKEGVQMITVRARRAADNSWLVSLKQA